MKKFLLFFSLLISFNLFSQPVIHWQNSIGGSNGDAAFVVKQTFDNGYILGGISNSNISGDKTENCRGAIDFWIVKIDSLGLVEWDKTIGGSADDDLFSLEQTADSGYIMGGRTYSGISGDKTDSSRGVTDYWVVKVDANGNILWQKTIGGNDDDGLTCISLSSDGGYLLMGGSATQYASGDKTLDSAGVWLVKLDSNGNILWQKNYYRSRVCMYSTNG